jgi:hypothetical protein
MLIPAMAFAWCVVSLPRPADAMVAPRPAHIASEAQMGASDPAAPGSTAPAETSLATGEIAGERTMIRGPLPPEVIAFAKTLVNLPMGAEQVAEIDGQRYVFVLQRHYHPPGFVGAPSGWHKGVTAFELQ